MPLVETGVRLCSYVGGQPQNFNVIKQQTFQFCDRYLSRIRTKLRPIPWNK
jgi:hypothetical protein